MIIKSYRPTEYVWKLLEPIKQRLLWGCTILPDILRIVLPASRARKIEMFLW